MTDHAARHLRAQDTADLVARVMALAEQAERLQEVVEFYAEAEHWVRYDPHDTPLCHTDRGRRARAALNGDDA